MLFLLIPESDREQKINLAFFFLFGLDNYLVIQLNSYSN